MGVIAACREVGGYRGATAMCGTTHKTVKRIERRSWSRVPSKRPQSVPHGFARRPDTYRRHPISNEQASRRATEHGPAGPPHYSLGQARRILHPHWCPISVHPSGAGRAAPLLSRHL